MIAALHWGNVLFALILASPAVVSAWFAYLTHRNALTPSGDPIGRVVEGTYDLAATNSAQLRLHGQELGQGKLDELGGNVDNCYQQMLEVLAFLKAEQERK